MVFFAASAFLKALGWALLNSIWQFALCWLLFRTFTAGKKMAAAARHTVALGLLCLGTFFFIIEFLWKYFTWHASSLLVIENTSWYNNWQSAGAYLDAIIPYWSLLYLVCVLLLFVKLCFFVQRAGNLQHNGISKIGGDWRALTNKIAAQLGIKKEIKAFLSAYIDTPQVIGFLKPVILIPAACLVNLSTEQLEAVLLHELVHIKRNDYLVNLFVAGVEILFFFNPFVKQLTGSIRREREYSCDDMVIQFNYHPGNYASALLTLEKNRLLPVTYGIAANGKNQKQLLTRIERILGVKRKQAGFNQAGAGLLILLLLGFVAGIHPVKKSFTNRRVVTVDLPANHFTGLEHNGEASTHVTLSAAPAGRVKKNDRPISVQTADIGAENDDMIPALSGNEGTGRSTEVLNAASSEARDFSLPEHEPVLVPADDLLTPGGEPYVPSSSFSYLFTQDTTFPKIKGETYNERKAREAMIKTQKALAAIDWQKIEKTVKQNKTGLAKLKRELTLQIQNLNWQRINLEVQDQLSREEVEKVQEAVKQEEMIKQYRQNEIYFEALQRQMNEQQQIIKSSDQRLQENQKTLVEKQKQLQQEMKKDGSSIYSITGKKTIPCAWPRVE